MNISSSSSSSSIYEIFHYVPSSTYQCPSISMHANQSNSSSGFLPLSSPPFTSCQLHNMTENYTNHVQLVDNNYLMRAPTHFDCYVLLFFARWCQFSVRFAPVFNALPRTFPGLDFVAYDVSKSLRYKTSLHRTSLVSYVSSVVSSRYMTYFGTNAVPSIFILRKNKLLARLNSTHDIQILVSLIESTLRMCMHDIY
jgi:thiol-disulfide isomerase/thioredoxin